MSHTSTRRTAGTAPENEPHPKHRWAAAKRASRRPPGPSLARHRPYGESSSSRELGPDPGLRSPLLPVEGWTVIRQCHFHMDEDVEGVPLSDGAFEFVCTRTGHPAGRDWSWLEMPPAPSSSTLGGLADELALADVLPEVVEALGDGWFEVGLVERAYAQKDPAGFGLMVDRWGHSAWGVQLAYSATTYLARTLGELSRQGLVSYHGGVGTGRWKYNSDISWWARVPAPPWESRTSWADLLGDDPNTDPCLEYVLQPT